MKSFGKKLRELAAQDTLTDPILVLVKMLLWARNREKHASDVYGTGSERTTHIFAAFIHNASCLIDSHIGSRELGGLQEVYFSITGFRFAADTHSGVKGGRPCMSKNCHAHVRVHYTKLTAILFEEPLRSEVDAILRTRYRDRLTYDPLQAS